MMNIRPFVPADLDALVELWRACNLLVPHNDPIQDIETCRSTEHGEVFVGTEGVGSDERIVAGMMVGHDGHRGGVYYLGVDPNCRHCGLGRAMIEHAEQWCRDRGLRKLNLMVRNTNAGVITFYERIGYQQQPVAVLGKWVENID